jgi:hypothetical protein
VAALYIHDNINEPTTYDSSPLTSQELNYGLVMEKIEILLGSFTTNNTIHHRTIDLSRVRSEETIVYSTKHCAFLRQQKLKYLLRSGGPYVLNSIVHGKWRHMIGLKWPEVTSLLQQSFSFCDV